MGGITEVSRQDKYQGNLSVHSTVGIACLGNLYCHLQYLEMGGRILHAVNHYRPAVNHSRASWGLVMFRFVYLSLAQVCGKWYSRHSSQASRKDLYYRDFVNFFSYVVIVDGCRPHW